jgi:hypothetical protein
MTTFRKGIPLLDVERTPRDFPGDLYFVLGQGLGDTVNGLRILKTVRETFRYARHIVYADKRWEEILLAIPGIIVRWYPEALDPRHPSRGSIGPYQMAENEMNSMLKKGERPVLWAFGHFLLPDQFSRGETTLESIARSIGLDLSPKIRRPYVPLDPPDGSDVRLLRDLGIEGDRYITICPHTWPARIWGYDRFTELGIMITALGYKIVVIGLPELGTLPIPEVINAFGLPLLDVAKIIRSSRLFIGHDSGITHMAAAFDISVIGIYTNAIFPTPEVRALSPYASLVIEPFPPETHRISVETIFNLSKGLLERELPLPNPICPACLSSFDYVVEASEAFVNRMCVCGVQLQDPASVPQSDPRHIRMTIPGPAREVRGTSEEEAPVLHPIDGEHLPADVTIAIRNPFSPVRLGDYPDWREGDAILSEDGLLALYSRNGLRPTESRFFNLSDRGELWSFRFSDKEPEGEMEFPWGGSRIRTASSLYQAFFTWQAWSTPLRWQGLAKAALESGQTRAALDISRAVYRLDRSFKNLRNLIRSLLANLR